MPKLDRVLETALYVDDLHKARQFYADILQLRLLVQDDRFCALDVGGRSVLLLFLRGASLTGIALPQGIIPPHDGAGSLHVAFAIAAPELPVWEARFSEHDVAVEARITWPRGGQSIYFRDPDGHLLELATPGLWAIY
jgi:catechol 2,3-dioxygenase-like lactoylglutathione lyase family enzyme